jgi:hypothetical protein
MDYHQNARLTIHGRATRLRQVDPPLMRTAESRVEQAATSGLIRCIDRQLYCCVAC